MLEGAVSGRESKLINQMIGAALKWLQKQLMLGKHMEVREYTFGVCLGISRMQANSAFLMPYTTQQLEMCVKQVVGGTGNYGVWERFLMFSPSHMTLQSL